MPADMAAAVEHARESLIEMVAESDEGLMERFFEAGTLTDEELSRGLRAATIAGKLFPLVCVSALANIGIPQLLDTIVALLPSPAERPFQSTDDSGASVAPRAADDKAPVSAFVWKTIADPFAGRITMFRVVTGTLEVGFDGAEQDAAKSPSDSAACSCSRARRRHRCRRSRRATSARSQS